MNEEPFVIVVLVPEYESKDVAGLYGPYEHKSDALKAVERLQAVSPPGRIHYVVHPLYGPLWADKRAD